MFQNCYLIFIDVCSWGYDLHNGNDIGSIYCTIMIFVVNFSLNINHNPLPIFDCNQYLGPATWGHRGCPDYAVCGSGISQSPIDLPRGNQMYADENHWMMQKVLTYQAIEYSSPYFTSTITGALFNNGHSGIWNIESQLQFTFYCSYHWKRNIDRNKKINRLDVILILFPIIDSRVSTTCFGFKCIHHQGKTVWRWSVSIPPTSFSLGVR